ncbi:hypothetical protein AB0L22_09245 [Micromonospora haikouensis]|uniref:hypothetical protein n=1 Tax=Micromonospora haikouensis TaxID=686309 RepID=UPI00342D9130
MATTREHRPYAVIRYTNATDAITYYEQQMNRRVVDVDHLRRQIAKAKAAGSSETVISQHATADEAEQAAAQRYAAPGVTYRAEYHDVGDLDAKCPHGVGVFQPCPECD